MGIGAAATYVLLEWLVIQCVHQDGEGINRVRVNC